MTEERRVERRDEESRERKKMRKGEGIKVKNERQNGKEDATCE